MTGNHLQRYSHTSNWSLVYSSSKRGRVSRLSSHSHSPLLPRLRRNMKRYLTLTKVLPRKNFIILLILPFSGFWCKWKSTGVLQQGGRGPQLVQGWRGEAEDELEHQKAAGDDQRASCCILLIWHFTPVMLSGNAKQNETNFAVRSRWTIVRTNMQTSCKKPTSFR